MKTFVAILSISGLLLTLVGTVTLTHRVGDPWVAFGVMTCGVLMHIAAHFVLICIHLRIRP